MLTLLKYILALVADTARTLPERTGSLLLKLFFVSDAIRDCKRVNVRKLPKDKQVVEWIRI